MAPSNSSNSAPISRYVNSNAPILALCVLCLISLTSSEVFCNHVHTANETLADSPDLTSRTHLQNDRVERPPRWTKHHVTHARIECSLMAGAFQTATRRVIIH